MVIYVGYLILVLVQSFFFWKTCRDGSIKFQRRHFLVLCCSELIILAGVRGYNIGADTPIYLRALNYYTALPKNQIFSAKLVYPFDFELGYFWLTKVAAWMGLSNTVFLFLVAAIIYIPVFISIYRYSKVPIVSIFAYFGFGMFTYSLGLFRQFISISIALYGVKYVEKREFWKFVIIVIIAMFFHTTALVVLPVYFLNKMHSKKLSLMLMPLELICLFMGRKIILILISIFPKYVGYLGSKYDTSSGTYLMLILINIIYFLAVYLYSCGCKITPFYINTLFLASLFQALGYSMGIFGRITPYYYIYLLFLLPELIYCFEKNSRLIIGLVLIIALLLLTINNISGNKYIVPYCTFWM